MRTRKGTELFVMAVSQWTFCASVLLLFIQGLQCSPTPPACPEPCLCRRGLLNCSSRGLSLAQQHIPSTVTELDLSHNLLNSLTLSWPSWGLKNLWLGHNNITHLSLCVQRTWRGKHRKIPLSHSRGRCVSWAAALQLLSAERNQLEMIPEGLGGSEFLQVLQLSHNRISDLRPGDLSRCPLLRELHLQHNRISSLHPQALMDLPELRVLDLSFNLLTTITPSAYPSLRNLNALVEVSGNRWRCDCSLRSLRRKMAYDRDSALQQTWRGVVCSSPSTHAGRDLLHLEESDLTCSTAENRAGLHQDVTVVKGTEILLPCSSPKQDSTWWTPNGQVPGSQAGLLISDITERDAGLYVCVSGPDEESVSVFDLRVHKTQRKARDTRGLHREGLQINPELVSIQREGQETDLTSLDLHKATQRTQSDLVLAVCLSVFITFLVAFVLGALTRPLLDTLWRRCCRCCRCCNRTKQSPSPPQSVSSAGPAPYDNEAYSDEEERKELGTHRERRVTFSGHLSELRDQNRIPYYDTVANGRQDNLVVKYDATYENVQKRDTSHASLEVCHSPEEKPRARDSVSSGSSQHDSPETDTHSGDKDLSDISLSEPQGGSYPVHTHGMEFESLPDPDELQGCRNSSHSDQESPDRGQDMDWPKDNLAQRLEESKTRNNPWEPQSPQKEDDSFERIKPCDVQQINIGRVVEIPGFTPELFGDWKSNMADPNPMDPELWNDSGESFEFPDSIQGASARSSSQDLSGYAEQAQNKETLVKDQRENDKSSSSSSSDIGNEPETEVVKEEGFNVSELRREVQRSPVFSEHSDSSSDSSDEPTKYTVNKESDKEEEDEAQVPDVTHKDQSLSLGDISVYLAPRKALNIGFSKEGFQYQPETETRSTGLGLSFQSAIIPKEPSLPSDGTSTGESPAPFYIPSLRRRLDIQAPQETPPAAPGSHPPAGSPSSSSESEDETTMNQKRDKKAKVPDSSFSSAGIEVSFAPRKALNIGFSKGFQYQSEPSSTGLDLTSQSAISTKEPLPKSLIPSDGTRDEESLVPLYIPSFKRHLDIQPPQETPPAAPQTPPPSGSSSSSSESEELYREVPDVPHKDPFLSLGDINVSIAPRKVLNIGFSKEGFQYQPEPETRSPSLGFSSQSAITLKEPLPQNRLPEGTRVGQSPLDIPSLRRRLDIQAPQETPPAAPGSHPPAGSSSSSSESEDETTMNQKREEKAKVPDSSFISGGIDVSFAPRKALNIGFSKEGFQNQPEPETRLTGLDLTTQSAISTKEPLPQPSLPSDVTRVEDPRVSVYIPRLSKRLDIQPPQEASPAPHKTSPPSESSSSSESEGETTDNSVKHDREVPDVSQKNSSLSLGDINVSLAPRKALNISSSMQGFKYQPEPEKWSTGLGLSFQSAIIPKEPSLPSDGTSTGESPAPFYIPSLRRRLDFQPPQDTPLAAPRTPPPSGSPSSSSESEDETTMNQKREEKAKIPDSSFISGGIDVSFAPRKALNIGFSKEGFQYQSEPDLTGLDLTSQSAISTKAPFPKSSIPSDGTRDEESLVPLYIPSFKRHLDIQPPQETPPAVPQTPPPSGSSSSSSESEELDREVPDVTHKDPFLSLGDINVSIAPRKVLNIGFSKEGFQYQPEPETRSPSLGFSSQSAITPREPLPQNRLPEGTRAGESPLDIPSLRRRLDIQAPQETPPAAPGSHPPAGSTSSSSESEDETTINQKREEKVPDSSFINAGIDVSFAPRKALNIGFSKEGFQYQSEPSSTGLDLTSQSAISTKAPFPKSSIPSDGTRDEESLVPLYIPSFKRHLDIQPPQDTPLAAPRTPPPSGSPSSSSESEDETTMNQKREEKAKIPDSSFISGGIDVSFAPRKALNIGFSKEGFQYQSEPDLTDLDLTSQSAISTKAPFPKSSIPSDGTRDEESLVPLYIPSFKRHLDIQPPQETPPAAPQTPPPSGSSSSSSESEDETAMNQKREEEKAKVPDVTYKYPPLSPGDTPINVSFVPRKALNIGVSKENFQYQSSESKYESITTTNDRGFQEDTKPAPKLSLPKTSILSSTSPDRARAEEPPVSLYIPGLRRHQNIHMFQEYQDAPLSESSSASSESGYELTEHTKKPGRDITDFSLSPGDIPINVSFAPRRALNIGLYNSASTTDEVERKTGAEDRWDRPGLGGLKALSETQRWNTKDSSTNMNVSFSQRSALNINSDNSTDEVVMRAKADYSSPILERTISRKDGGFEEETNPSPQLSLPKTSRFFSTSRPRESPLQIPRHRRRLVVDIQPPLTSPTAPETPPPFPEGEEAADSGWRIRGQQRRKAMDGFGSTSMTQGDEGERSYMGLLAVKPFGTARQYQSVTSETIMTTQHSENSERDGSDVTFSTVRHSEA